MIVILISSLRVCPQTLPNFNVDEKRPFSKLSAVRYFHAPAPWPFQTPFSLLFAFICLISRQLNHFLFRRVILSYYRSLWIPENRGD